MAVASTNILNPGTDRFKEVPVSKVSQVNFLSSPVLPLEPSCQHLKSSRLEGPVGRDKSAPNSKSSLPVGRAIYKMHFTNQKIWKEIRKKIDEVIVEQEGARELGLLQDEKGSVVKGSEEKYKALVSTITSLVKKSSPNLEGFHFSALAITKGWYWVESITDHVKTAECIQDHSEPQGERALITWVEKRLSDD